MRDKHFVTLKRRGLLPPEQHKLLIRWAYTCIEHLIPQLNFEINPRILRVIQVAKDWENGKISVGDARKAAVDMLALARESINPAEIALIRGTGHAVATAHMADHSMGGALYSLKALKSLGIDIKNESEWQIKQLSPEVTAFILPALQIKKHAFGIE